MARKETRVKLVVPIHGTEQMFSVDHAARLLAMGAANGGWELPSDSRYYFDKENGLRLKPNKDSNKQAR